MVRQCFAIIAIGSLCLAGALGQDTKDAAEEVKKDLMQLEGAWAAVSVEREGNKETCENFLKDFKVVFKDDKDLGPTVTARHPAKFKIDPSKKPKTIDVMPTDGPDKDKTIEGIYELKGDELKVCIAIPTAGKERPTAFETKPGSGTVLLVMKKDKADK